MRNLAEYPEIRFTIARNFYSTDDNRGQIRRISVKNLNVAGVFHGVSLKGFDEEHRIEDVSVEGIYIHSGDQVKRYENEIPYVALEFADKIKLVR